MMIILIMPLICPMDLGTELMIIDGNYDNEDNDNDGNIIIDIYFYCEVSLEPEAVPSFCRLEDATVSSEGRV